MKKLMALLLILCLFVPAAFAMAEDEPVVMSESYPNIAFGEAPKAAMDYFDLVWGTTMSYASETTEETITLLNGTEIQVITREAVPTDNTYASYVMPATVKFFFRNGKLIAATQEITVKLPEGYSIDMVKPSITGRLTDVQSIKLHMEDIGIYAELLKDVARLEEGQEAWQYASKVGVNGTLSVPIQAYMTLQITDDKVYMAEFPDLKATGTTQAGELSLAELKGFNELSDEKKASVQMMAKYLLQQLKNQLENYIEFAQNEP